MTCHEPEREEIPVQMAEWGDASVPLEETFPGIVTSTISCDTNGSVTIPGVAVMNFDDEMCNHVNRDQFTDERVTTVRNQCIVNDTSNHIEKMDAVTTYNYRPPSAKGCQPQHNDNRNPLPNSMNPNHTRYLVNPITYHHHP